MTLTHLSDDALLSSLSTVCFEARRLLGRLLVHLIEVEARRLDLRSACSSLFDFCVRRLGMSESEAFRRIDAARLVKRFPCLLEHLEQGHVNLTALLLLRDHFTTDNVDELALAARGKTKRQLQELVAARAPKPDVMPTITELPPAPLISSLPSAPPPRPVPTQLVPLAPSRHRLELTVSDSIRDKLERARDLMSHCIPDGNLELVLERALDALLAKLEMERPGGDIPRATRRDVFARDGERCTYTGAHGNRCEARMRLEIDHVVPRARGGSNEASNLRLRCRLHNRLHAEQSFGREHVERQIHLRQRRPNAAALDTVRSALTKMGFRDRDVRRTLGELWPPEATLPPMPELIRAALQAMV